MSYIVAGYFKFTAESEQRGKETMADMVRLGRTEQGILQYNFYSNPDVERGYFLYEEWESQQSHDDHFNREEMQSWIPEFLGLLAEPPTVSYYDATLSSTLEV